ncbi:cysteine-rich secretory protein-related [Holotrichia oblita]|uniref:Cysteine-rich secretory protein-related n=1 Tax=Holotrichia oblita TaxID=644536 RepID=A0ACB9TZ12_HOLOL|nr:cysteine-rich secretory protein-related [Holotrichia oblita]
MPFTHLEKCDMMECYIVCNKNSLQARERYGVLFPTRNLPDRRYFLLLYRKFRSNENVFKKTRTKKQFIISEATEINVLAFFEANPNNAINDLKEESGLSVGTIHDILKNISLCRSDTDLFRRWYREIKKDGLSFVSGTLIKLDLTIIFGVWFFGVTNQISPTGEQLTSQEYNLVVKMLSVKILCVGIISTILVHNAESCANPELEIFENGVSHKDIVKIVHQHNQYRQAIMDGSIPGQPKGVGLKHLKWDEKLAKSAQDVADKCVFKHSNFVDERWKQKVGENIFRAGKQFFESNNSNWTQAIESWFSEHVHYHYGPFGKGYDKYGHYTALIWDTTEFVGCGYAAYDNDLDPNLEVNELYVCQYGPPFDLKFYLTGIKCQFRFKTLPNMIFSQLHKRFIIGSYFRNGNLENGEWRYSTVACLVKFRQQFPDFVFLEAWSVQIQLI